MKLAKTNNGHVSTTNLAELVAYHDVPLANTPYWPLLQVLADVIDNAGAGGQTFAVLGTTRARTAASLAVTLEGEKATHYAANLADLSTACADWL